jgi:uncharacterized membrane protein
LLFVARPIRPPGRLCPSVATFTAALAACWIILPFANIHDQAYTIFLNGYFIRALVVVAALFGAAWLLWLTEQKEPDRFIRPVFAAMAGLLLLWVLLTLEIWHYWRCIDRYRVTTPNWRFLAHMCISIMWAVYASGLLVVGFWRRIGLLRYAALAVFVLLLAKIFIVDTQNVENLYRIAGFLVTGLVLVGVSYLYQYLKKQGFFDKMLAGREADGE